MEKSEMLEFVEAIQAWHANQCRQLKLIVDAPEDTQLCLAGESGEVQVTGRDAKMFKAGVAVALDSLGKLPFTVSSDEEE